MKSFILRPHHIAQLLVVLACACSTADANPAPNADGSSMPREILVTTTDFAFHAPDTVPAGLTRIRLRNRGPEYHHLQIVRLEDGHSMEDLLDQLADGEFTPSWATFVGGPEAVSLNREIEASLVLSPGNYAFICVVSSADGVRHVAKGMAHALTVVPASVPSAASGAEPQADVRITLRDYAFDIAPEIQSGRRTIRVENVAQQPHHVDFVRLNEGKTAVDAERWQRIHDGPPPFEPAGGVTALAPGMVNIVTMDFTPGNYVLLCFVPDAKDGKPHVAHGMQRQITVR